MLPWRLSDKESACQCRRLGLIPGVGGCPGEGKKKHILVFLPGKLPRTGETWWAMVHGVTKSWTQFKS